MSLVSLRMTDTGRIVLTDEATARVLIAQGRAERTETASRTAAPVPSRLDGVETR